MEDTLNLRQLLLIIRRYFILILAFVVIFGIIGFVYSNLQKNASNEPTITYQADTKIYFTLTESQNEKTDSYKTAAIADLITSNQIAGTIAQQLGLENIGDAGSVSATALEHSTVVTLSITNPEETLAVEYAGKIADVLILSAKETGLVSDAQIIASPAAQQIVQLPPTVTPRSTQNIKTTAVFLVVGLFLGLACAFFLNYIHAKFYDAEEAAQVLGLRIVARIRR